MYQLCVAFVAVLAVAAAKPQFAYSAYPATSYIAPATSYVAPAASYDALAAPFIAPATPYIAPATSYIAPAESYVVPAATTYSAYAAPSLYPATAAAAIYPSTYVAKTIAAPVVGSAPLVAGAAFPAFSYSEPIPTSYAWKK